MKKEFCFQIKGFMKDITKHYTNGEVTIVWKPAICQHSGNCVRGLPMVFNWARRPWIVAENATTRRTREPGEKMSEWRFIIFYE